MCQGAEAPDPLSLGRNCDERPDAGYGRCQSAFPEAHSTCPLSLTPENHLADCTTPFGPATTVSFFICSLWEPASWGSVPWWLPPDTAGQWPGEAPSTDSKKEGGKEEAATKGAGASALALLPDPGPRWPCTALWSYKGCGASPAGCPHIPPRSWGWRQQGWALLLYLDSASRWTKGEGGTKLRTLQFSNYKLLSTLKWQQSPLRSHLIFPLNFLSGEENSNVFFILEPEYYGKTTRAEGECWAAWLGMDPKHCVEAGHRDQKVF